MAELLTLDLSQVHNLGDCEDDVDDEENEEEEVDPLSDDLSAEENLPPMRRILNAYTSDDNDKRQLCVRLFPEALQTITTVSELNMLLQVSFILARDHFYIIRIGLLSNVPCILDKIKELIKDGQDDCISESRQHLLEVTVRMLTDSEMEVRRMGQNVIVNLLGEDREQEEKDELLEKLFPIIKRCLGKEENYELRTNAAMLISKMSSLVGQVNVLRYFVPLLPSLATDTMFHVRKAFAMSCRELCPVLDEELTEKYILPLFLTLCKDEVWGVRKACADVFSEIALTCNLGTRYDYLTPTFLKLLHDDSRWVRKAAYQSLGALISTFYVPNGNRTPEEEDEEGEGGEEGDSSIGLLSDSFLQDNSLLESTLGGETEKSATTTDLSSDHRHPLPDDNASSVSASSTPNRPINGTSPSFGDEDPHFSSFKYWRSPIPSLPDDGVISGKEGLEEGKGVELVTPEGDEEVSDESKKDARGRLSFEGSDQGGDEEKMSVGKEGVSEEKEEEESKTTPPNPEERNTSNKDRNFEADSADTRAISSPTTGSSEDIERAGDYVALVTTTSTDSDQSSSDDNDGNKIEKSSEVEIKENISTSSELTCGGGGGGDSGGGGGEGTKKGLLVKDGTRVRSSSAGSAVRRISVDSSLASNRPPNQKVLMEHKKRRWSLDRPYPAGDIPQVRVFIHSVSGAVTEQDISSTPPTSPLEEEAADQTPPPIPSDDAQLQQDHEDIGGGEPPIEPSLSSHDYTTTKSESMDLTLEAEPSGNQGNDMYIDQEIVPDELMEIYLSMTEHSRVQSVDTDLLYYCAYSLPGVALTLGRANWLLLKPTFSYLAEDLQWKIRRVLSFSLHELARILGPDITCVDILPIFEEYCTKDVDDVKIGALTHLTDFFVLLPEDVRKIHLPAILDGLLQMENQKNWRYRKTLAEQLLQLSDHFDADFILNHLYPLANILVMDKVSEVRNTANMLIGELLKKISGGDPEVCHTLLLKLRTSNLPCSNWLRRLMYVKQCELFLLNKCVSHEIFARECLANIIWLARDRIPNVRIAVAKFLESSIITCDYFQTEKSDAFSLEEIQITLECLQHDADRDVKFFAGGEIVEVPKATRKPSSNRTRSVSHTSSDMDQYSDASEYFDLDSTNQTLQSSLASSSTIHRPQPSLSTEYLDLTPSSSQFSTPSSSAEVTVVSEQREHDEGVADNTEKSHDKSPDTVEVSHEDTVTNMEVEGGKGDNTTEEVKTVITPPGDL